VSQVRWSVEYLDASGRHHKVTKAASAHAAESQNNSTEAQKQALKIKHAEQIKSRDLST